MKRLISLLTAFALLVPTCLNAGNLKFSGLIGDNMVLQQSTTVRIWGYSSPNATVSVSASWSATASARADSEGHWEVQLKTPKATFAPQSLKARSGNESIQASNILIGEVWICSGQSNMEMTLGGGFGTPVEHSLEEIALSSQYKGVRHITVNKATTLEPAYDAEGVWKTANPNDAPRFSAVAYFFASRLSKALEVPVGVINASWGGSMISPWMSKESLVDYPKVNLPDATDNSVNAMFKPYVMYNGMFKPVSKLAANGIIWYQGESNVSTRVEDYASMLETMARTWRSDIGRGDIPFLIVELPPYDYEDGQYGLQDEHGPLIREQQFLASKAIPNCGLVGTNDLAYDYELKQVHPSQKLPIGERLCFMAMQMAYGFSNLGAVNPCFKSATANGRTVRITFDNARSGFLGNTDITGFEIAGAGGYFHAATATTGFSFPGGSYVELTAPEVPQPKFVRYCYRDFQIGTLKSANGLPVIPFCAEVKPDPATEKRSAYPGSKVVIIYENDPHSTLSGYVKMAALKDSISAETSNIITVSSGDFSADFFPGNKLGNRSKGAGIIRIMNEIGYDFVVPGNHDFDYSIENLQENFRNLKAKALCCNFTDAETGKAVLPGYAVRSIGGIKIGFVGVATPKTASRQLMKYFADADGKMLYSFCEDNLCKVVQQNVDKARAEGADYVIVLSHLGDKENGSVTSPDLIANTTGIDVVLDAHAHTLIPDRRVDNKDGKPVILTSTGLKFANIGLLTIGTDGKVSSQLIPTEGIAPDEKMQKFVDKVEMEFPL